MICQNLHLSPLCFVAMPNATLINSLHCGAYFENFLESCYFNNFSFLLFAINMIHRLLIIKCSQHFWFCFISTVSDVQFDSSFNSYSQFELLQFFQIIWYQSALFNYSKRWYDSDFSNNPNYPKLESSMGEQINVHLPN